MVEGRTTSQTSSNPLLKHFAVGVFLLNILVAGIVWLSLHNSRTHYEEQAAIGSRNISLVLHENISHIFQKVDLALQAVGDEAERQLATGAIEKASLNSYIVRQHSRLPELVSLRATDASGDAIYGPQSKVATTTSLAQRNYFKFLRDNPGSGMVISKPLIGGISGKWMIVLAKRINGHDGSFAGLVYAGLGLEHLSRSFKELNVGTNGSITLLDHDMSLVVRYPMPAPIGIETGQKPIIPELLEQIRLGKTSATFSATSPIDGVERLFSYRTLSHNQPFYIITGLSPGDYLADWRSEVYKTLLLWAAFCIGTIVLAWLFGRSWNKTSEAVQKNQFLEVLLETIPNPIFYKDVNGRYTGCNRAFENFFERPRHEILGKTVYDVGTKEVAEKYEQKDRELFDHPGTQRYEWQVRRKSGEIREVIFDKATFVDGSGHVGGLIGVISDITDRKRAEEAQRESEANFRTFFESMSDMIFVVSPEGRLIFANTAVTRTLGHSPGELAVMPLLDIHPEDKRREAEEIFAAMLRGERETCPLPVAAKNGTLVPVETRVWFGRWNGEDCVFGISKNLTAQVEAQQRFERLFHNNPAPMAVSTLPDLCFTQVNDAFLETLGYSRVEVIGKTSKELGIFPHPTQKAEATKRLETTGRISDIELKVRRKDGVILDGLFSGEVISSQGREYFLTVMIDITARKQTENQRLQWERRLQQAQKAESLSRMAGAIAHNFNNMLGAVIGNLELAQDDLPRGSDPQICVSEALEASQRAAMISRFMLTYLGQTTWKADPIDPMAVIREVCSLLSPSLPGNVRLRADLSSAGPIIKADSAHLTQILTNLISNAAEAIGEKEGEITLTIDVVSAGDLRGLRLFPPVWEPKAAEYVCLSVTDSGHGIAPENLDKVFDPFFSTKFTGRGLGLPVVLGLLQGFEGGISVAGRPDQGTTFKVFLPLSEQVPLASPENEAPLSDLDAGGGLVLVVDDEAVIRNMAESILRRKLGYEVVTACDGFEALEIFKARKVEIDFVILDLMMPGMDGWTTLSALRAVRPDISVILSSGYDETQVNLGEHMEQPQAFLSKPYGAKSLRDAIVTVQNRSM